MSAKTLLRSLGCGFLFAVLGSVSFSLLDTLRFILRSGYQIADGKGYFLVLLLASIILSSVPGMIGGYLLARYILRLSKTRRRTAYSPVLLGMILGGLSSLLLCVYALVTTDLEGALDVYLFRLVVVTLIAAGCGAAAAHTLNRRIIRRQVS